MVQSIICFVDFTDLTPVDEETNATYSVPETTENEGIKNNATIRVPKLDKTDDFEANTWTIDSENESIGNIQFFKLHFNSTIRILLYLPLAILSFDEEFSVPIEEDIMDHNDQKNQVKDILDLIDILNQIEKEEQKQDKDQNKVTVPKESGTAWTQR